MAIVTSYDWESDTWTQHRNEASERVALRAAVAEIAAKAKETLPDCAGRVDAAVKIVLAGDVELLPEDTARVASQSHGTPSISSSMGAVPAWILPRLPATGVGFFGENAKSWAVVR
jgi:hypothetical protein